MFIQFTFALRFFSFPSKLLFSFPATDVCVENAGSIRMLSFETNDDVA